MTSKTRRVLVPVDFSDCSAEVVAEAARVAAPLGAELFLLHVLQVPEGLSLEATVTTEAGGPTRTVAETLSADAEERLEGFVAQAEELGLRARALVEPGTPADAILAAAEAVEPEMVVMGTHGRRGVSRWLLGSVAAKVLRHADVPVLTVRTRHKPECEARNCAWCGTHMTTLQQRLQAETNG